MSIKKVSTEQAFDMLPHVADIYTNLKIKEFLKNNASQAKKNQDVAVLRKLAGADLVIYILKNSPKAKDSFFHIVSVFEGKTLKEVKDQPLLKTIASVKAILNDEDLMGFFNQAV